MAKLVFGLWTTNSEKLNNESVTARLHSLNTKIDQVINASTTTPSFIVFVAAEFLFAHAAESGDCIRWYTRTERDEALTGLAGSSRRFTRLLLVGGTILWAKKVSHAIEKCEWLVRNEAPVHYCGQQLALYGKRLPGGEVYGQDALRLYKSRKGNLDLEMWVGTGTKDSSGQRQHAKAQATGTMNILGGTALRDVPRGPGGSQLPAAPGLRSAYEHYSDRIRFDPGKSEPSFDIPGGSFTGGVEICQEHGGRTDGMSTLQAISKRGATNFHILTSNTTSYKNGYENLLSPGYFVHCNAGAIVAKLVTRFGEATRDVNAKKLAGDLFLAEVDMPRGL